MSARVSGLGFREFGVLKSPGCLPSSESIRTSHTTPRALTSRDVSSAVKVPILHNKKSEVFASGVKAIVPLK